MRSHNPVSSFRHAQLNRATLALWAIWALGKAERLGGELGIHVSGRHLQCDLSEKELCIDK